MKNSLGQFKKGHSQSNTGRTHFKKGVPNNIRESNPMWKGGKHKMKAGYVLIKISKHPHIRKGGYVSEHRLVMEEHLGRYLKPTEAVHHINGIKHDNRIKNLQLVAKFYHYGKIQCPFCNKKFAVR